MIAPLDIANANKEILAIMYAIIIYKEVLKVNC